MPNHFHLMVYATGKSCLENYGSESLKIQSLTYWIGILQSSYAQAINKQNGTSGSLFQSKTKAKALYEDLDIMTCVPYIHQNPFKANLVAKMEEWTFSSFADYAGLRNGNLCNKQMLFNLTGYDKANFGVDSRVAIDETHRFY